MTAGAVPPPDAPAASLECARASERSGLEQLRRASDAYVADESSANTRRGYSSDWRVFSAWCEANGLSAMPAAGDDVALFLVDQVEQGRTVSTLNRRLAAIRDRHLKNDQVTPFSRKLKSVWAGIRRRHGRPPEQKRPLLTADLKAMVGALPASPAGIRDRAIILIGFASALRREELASLELGGRGRRRLDFAPGGIEIVIEVSKGDQEAAGARIGIPYGSELCPVRAVREWLNVAQIAGGPLFRSVDRWGCIAETAIDAGSVNRIVKRAASAAGIDATAVGAHSLRAGMATQAILNGVDASVAMKQTRHKRLDTFNMYVRIAGMLQASAAGNLGL